MKENFRHDRTISVGLNQHLDKSKSGDKMPLLPPPYKNLINQKQSLIPSSPKSRTGSMFLKYNTVKNKYGLSVRAPKSAYHNQYVNKFETH